MRTKRSLRHVTHSMFPRSYWVYQYLSLRVREDGVTGNQLPFRLLRTLVPAVAEQLRERADRHREWNCFRHVDEDRLELVEPSLVRVDVEPTTWWCSNCGDLFTGQIAHLGIQRGECPRCRQRRINQLNAVFMCPRCHRVDPIEKPPCPDCGDSRSVILRGGGGRRREYRWKCNLHPAFEQDLFRHCRVDGTRMALKATGGRLYLPARISNVQPLPLAAAPRRDVGDLGFELGRANVIEVVIGRIPIANMNDYFRRHEQSVVEPFLNPTTGAFRGFVHRLETDALTMTLGRDLGESDLALHSLKHALLNAAPAVTGLVQEEFGAEIFSATRQILIYDNVQGGSGGCRLLAERRLERWLQVARELAECHQVQCDDACRACLFLPTRICRRGNNELDRHLVLQLIT